VTPQTPRQVHVALIARLRTDPALVVFDGEPGEHGRPTVPTAKDGTANPYVIAWPPTGHREHGRLAPGYSARRSRLWVTVAGGDTTRCLWALERVENLLDGWPPTGDARRGRLTHDLDPGPPQVDRDVDPHRVYVVTQWTLTGH